MMNLEYYTPDTVVRVSASSIHWLRNHPQGYPIDAFPRVDKEGVAPCELLSIAIMGWKMISYSSSINCLLYNRLDTQCLMRMDLRERTMRDSIGNPLMDYVEPYRYRVIDSPIPWLFVEGILPSRETLRQRAIREGGTILHFKAINQHKDIKEIKL